MLFPTVEFVVFFLFFLCFWTQACHTHRETPKIACLCIFNLFFYGFYSTVMLAYLVGWAGLLYLFARPGRKYALLIALVMAQMVFWKMIDAKWLQGPSVPLGVSFFTFQGLTYLLAVHRKPAHLTQYHIESPWNFFKVFAFVGFFPTVFSGPILRAKPWEDSLSRPTVLTPAVLHKALALVALGCLYKLCFSSILHDYVSEAFASPGDTSSVMLVGGMYAYALELFHDFAGYSLMSMGIALMMGFEIPANFRSPYFSSNIKEFWQRWHISLSSWLRDYVYFYLGGSKTTSRRQLINIAIVMTLSGAWHGLALNYLVWGLMHTLAIVWYHMAHSDKPRMPRAVAGVLLFHYVALAWVFFRSPDASSAWTYLVQMFSLQGGWGDLSVFFYALMFICLWFQYKEAEILDFCERLTWVVRHKTLFVFFWSAVFILILMLSPSGMPPFIYFSY